MKGNPVLFSGSAPIINYKSQPNPLPTETDRHFDKERRTDRIFFVFGSQHMCTACQKCDIESYVKHS